jgi:ABC-type antimicrobial peptide transport system ATPase subunit
MAPATPPLLEVTDLSVSFPSEGGRVAAVRSLSYEVNRGDVLGIVGESGSGKTVSSLAVMSLLPRQATVAGSVRFRGEELLGRSDAELSAIRGRRIAMIFQDPLSGRPGACSTPASSSCPCSSVRRDAVCLGVGVRRETLGGVRGKRGRDKGKEE